jgi:hypothetical protein
MLPKFLNVAKLPLPRQAWRRPKRETLQRLTWGGLLALALVGAFCWGRLGAPSVARGQAPKQPMLDPTFLQQAARGDYSGHVVAYICGDVPITREELGEYLVQRIGADWLEFLVNHKIIERACAAKNIHISDAEITGQLAEDLKGFNLTERQFVDSMLRPHNKTLFEWREDVIWPKLALQRFVQDRVAVNEEDIQKAFEAKFGPKVECRLIALSKDHAKDKYDIWTRASKGLAEFEQEAKAWNIPGPLQAEAGKVPPISKHFADPNIEKEAFQLKPGETSPLIGMQDGSVVILHCIKHIPADTTKNLDQERSALHREVYEARVGEAIKTVFVELRKQADPHVFLKRDNAPEASAQVSRNPGPPQQQ